MPTSKNIPWINTMKVICMLLVYINHSEIFYNCRCAEFGWWYRPVFVNAFFFISGYLLLRKQWSPEFMGLNAREWLNMPLGGGKTLIFNVLYKLVIPTTIIWALAFIPKAIAAGNFDIERFLLVTIGGDSAWFTMALAVAELLIIVCLAMRIKKKYMYVIIAILLWGVSEYLRSSGLTCFGNSSVPWYYKSGMDACIFLIMGGLFSKVERHYSALINTVGRHLIAGILLLALYSLLVITLHSEMRTALDWQGMNITGFIVAMIGIFALKEFITIMPASKTMDYIGRHTIGLYFFSAFIPKAVVPVLNKFLPDVHNYGMTLSIAGVSFLIALFIVYLLNRFTPFIFDLRLLKFRK